MNTGEKNQGSSLIRMRVTFSTLVAVLLALSFLAWGQEPKVNPLAPKIQAGQKTEGAPTAANPMTAADVEAFVDGLMPLTLERDDIAGAVVTVVKDGKVLFAKGYGYADVKTKKPVSPSDTLFRPGSVSKLFTWTAVMQQVEQGKLDLDRDINDYLDFKIPEKFGKPITLRNLMTHTPGFSETAKDEFLKDPKDLTSLHTYLINHMPERIFPPGSTPAYSNYGATLAGYIVERVSGKPFNEYVAENIFRPLQMPHSTFEQPLPADLKPLMSSGYKTASKDAEAYEYVEPAPAGSSAVSAIDMTHFMLAHLQGGEYNGARILKPETVQMMHMRQALPAGDALNAMCLGFYEESRNGHRIIGHAGDTVYFHSDLHLMPDANLGFFVSYNSPGKGTISDRSTLWHYFLDRYFPYTVPATPTLTSAASDSKEVTGSYMVSRRLQGNFLSSLAMVGENKVTANADGTVTAGGLDGFNGEPIKFREISSNVFRNINGQEKIAFYKGYDGRMNMGIDYPFMVFQRVGVLDSKTFNLIILIGSLSIMVLTLLLWPIAALIRRHYRLALQMEPLGRRLRLWTRLVCLIDILVVVGFVAVLSDSTALNDRLDKWIHLVQILGVIGVIGTFIVIYNAVYTWRRTSSVLAIPSPAPSAAVAGSGETSAPVMGVAAPSVRRRGTAVRIYATLIALSSLGFTWFLLYWGVLNFSLNY